jgi:hypothetical protein
MLNWAARYYPIIRILKAYGLYDSASLLEIGSGSIGIGRFRKVPFIGCDISFPFEPVWPMTPMIASAAQLPIKDNEFDVVLASDVLEHVPPDLRKAVIDESLRVARKLVIFGFPCGELAWESDRALLEAYLQKKRTPPEWLTEHMEANFPGPELFREIDGWEIEHHDNESISFHSWLMRREMSRVFVKVSSVFMRIAPSFVETLLSKANRGPVYRKIFVLRKLAT